MATTQKVLKKNKSLVFAFAPADRKDGLQEVRVCNLEVNWHVSQRFLDEETELIKDKWTWAQVRTIHNGRLINTSVPALLQLVRSDNTVGVWFQQKLLLKDNWITKNFPGFEFDEKTQVWTNHQGQNYPLEPVTKVSGETVILCQFGLDNIKWVPYAAAVSTIGDANQFGARVIDAALSAPLSISIESDIPNLPKEIAFEPFGYDLHAPSDLGHAFSRALSQSVDSMFLGY